MEYGVDAVFEACAVGAEIGALRRLRAELAGLGIGDPDAGEVVTTQ